MSDYCNELTKMKNDLKTPLVSRRTIASIAATAAMLSKASDGTTWSYDEEHDNWYYMEPANKEKLIPYTEGLVEIKNEWGETVNTIQGYMIAAYDETMKSGIPNLLGTQGSKPGIQGSYEDFQERMCQDFSILLTNHLNKIYDDQGNRKFYAKAVALVGKWTTGKDKGKGLAHAVVKIEDRSRPMVYWIDPLAGVTIKPTESVGESIRKELIDPRNWTPFATTEIPLTFKIDYAGTLIEPQNGIIGKTGYDLTGTEMKVCGENYIITHTEEFEKPIQMEAYNYLYGQAKPTLFSRTSDIITHDDRTIKKPTVGIIKPKIDISEERYNYLDKLKGKDEWTITAPQTNETRAKNILLTKRENLRNPLPQEKTTEELIGMWEGRDE